MNNQYLARIAYYYYIKNKTQSEIARLFKVSRQKINRDLKMAQKLGIVKVDIDFPINSDIELEANLEENCNLKKAIVIKSSEEILKKELANAAKEFLDNYLSDGMTIGVTWGTTLYELAKVLNVKNFKNIKIKQLIGGVNPNYPNLSGENIARIFANKLGGSFTSFYLPAIVSDRLTKKILLEENDTLKAYEGMDKCDLVIAGVGSIERENTVSKLGYLSEENRKLLLQKGIVGDLGLIYYDRKGIPYFEEGAPISLGYNLFEKPKDMKLMVIAGGEEKAEAIKAILNGKIVDILITDKNCANKIVCK
ncbi:MAG: sugar-binding domain-containing protein [Tissierellia bacterium]|nr:sugar-binding domain-containing protein [Tissierellia bacterium]